MTVIARFEVIPVREGSMSTTIAEALRALDRHPVSYETTPTDTVIEADTVDQVFAAVQAAHEAIPEDRVITSVEVDEDRRRPQGMHERVASVEQQLGHPPQRTTEHRSHQSRPAQQAPPVGQMHRGSSGGQMQSPRGQAQAPPTGQSTQPAPGPQPSAPGQPRPPDH